MPRYSLRTLLIVMAVLPPAIAVWYHRCSDESLWRRLIVAKRDRDAALQSWRVAYDAVQSGKAPESQEESELDRYYQGRERVELAFSQLLKRYGGEKGLAAAYEARRKAK